MGGLIPQRSYWKKQENRSISQPRLFDGAVNECSEDDPQILAAVDDAIQKAEAVRGRELKNVQKAQDGTPGEL